MKKSSQLLITKWIMKLTYTDIIIAVSTDILAP